MSSVAEPSIIAQNLSFLILLELKLTKITIYFKYELVSDSHQISSSVIRNLDLSTICFLK